MSEDVWVVVLAGGVGSRFWPLSTPDRPKQLLPLVTSRPLLLETLERVAPLAPAERTLILTNASIAGAIATAAERIPSDNIIAEPRPAGTAAALAYAASVIESRAGSHAVMVCVHADWYIADEAGFRATLSRAADFAREHGGLVTVGIVPSRPDPGFGYVEPGDAADGARRVRRFVEKPDRERAATMVASGYLWNSGIFVWRVGDFLGEIRRLTPEVKPAIDTFESAPGSLARFFASVKPISVDVGVLERSDRVFVIPGDFGWDDVGTWAALHRVGHADASGNVVSGLAFAADSHDNVVHAEGSAVVLFGVSDLVVVTRGDLTVVTTRERSADLKNLIDSLPPEIASRT